MKKLLSFIAVSALVASVVFVGISSSHSTHMKLAVDTSPGPLVVTSTPNA